MIDVRAVYILVVAVVADLCFSATRKNRSFPTLFRSSVAVVAENTGFAISFMGNIFFYEKFQ